MQDVRTEPAPATGLPLEIGPYSGPSPRGGPRWVERHH
jgi:hypothetical protein